MEEVVYGTGVVFATWDSGEDDIGGGAFVIVTGGGGALIRSGGEVGNEALFIRIVDS